MSDLPSGRITFPTVQKHVEMWKHWIDSVLQERDHFVAVEKWTVRQLLLVQCLARPADLCARRQYSVEGMVRRPILVHVLEVGQVEVALATVRVLWYEQPGEARQLAQSFDRLWLGWVEHPQQDSLDRHHWSPLAVSLHPKSIPLLHFFSLRRIFSLQAYPSHRQSQQPASSRHPIFSLPVLWLELPPPPAVSLPHVFLPLLDDSS